MSKLLSIFYVILIFTACTSVQQTKKQEETGAKLKPWHENLKNLTAKGQITLKQKDSQMTGKYKASIAGTDSLSLSLYGPLQIVAGKLYARYDYFLFFDSFNSTAFEGAPSASNLKAAFNIELAFEDMIRLFRNETPHDVSLFALSEKHEKGALYKYIKQNEYVDFVLVADNGSVLQYQRKLIDGSAVMNTMYSDFETTDNYYLPKKIVFNFPAYDATVTLVIDGYSVNEEYTQPFSFSVPSDIKRKKF